ncbi:aminoacyl-histidine dipeptidase [Ferrimonas balearica]|uniref:aminoacyl-histidine dipeptidase n=1 Tax=Ferrimonas balearica TaxID=44012 RepID=UPI001C98EB97|nr:aminoacyl-histidine dipeptidase [Ferrimonas balearica]MBY5921419.1 aminoacyl-histidine dipeptidase [Ferrimonas balearica]MBY5995896.1 aminoacyl-histidine dipeptidase [Ferrimonas balearica]
MSALSTLSPQGLWTWFETICSIPHPSKREIALRDHIQQWAEEKGLETVIDGVGNLVIRKAATPGYEHLKGVIIQAHLDMVPQKNSGTEHRFDRDPIQAYIDGDWVTAKDTTLGADNGIGMASALAVLGDDSVEHGPLEVLLTIDEEAGMTGAFGLEAGLLKGDILINTDSEEEGEVYMGCAGGVDAELTLPVGREATPADHVSLQLALTGLKGGHSGCDIHTGRGNANKLLGRFLFGHAAELGLRLAKFKGGSLRNAIPREAFAEFVIPSDKVAELERLVGLYTDILKNELQAIETDLSLELSAIDAPAQVFNADDQARLVALIHAGPNGVIRMSDAFPGVVETSLNMGVITTKEESVRVMCLIRSTVDSGRSMVENMLQALADLAGAELKLSGAYPGWQPDPSSPIMAVVRETYQGLFGKLPNIQVIHAGLECGLFKEPYPALDMVSIGPTIRFPHSPDEKVEIATVEKYWQLLLAVLKAIPTK